MTHFEFNVICVKNCITPSLVWEHPEFRKLVNSENLNPETLQELINNNF